MIELKSTDDNKLKQIVDRNYAEISSEDYRFDRLATEIKLLKGITQAEVLKCYEDSILYNKKIFILAIEG